MAATGFTPIQLYRTTTASAQPSAGNLADGELAINLTDKKLYAKDASNNVFVLADASSGGTTATNLAGGAAGSVPYQTGASTTTFLGIGTAAQVLQVNSGATAPEWVNTSGTGDVARTTSPSFTTPSLGAATALSINSLTITTSTGTFTLANGKTLTVNNSLTLSGTDATTMTFPSTSATIARTDAAQTFTGTQTVQAAATQDAVALAGRAGGTSSYVSTLTPTTLSASRTVTLPDADTTVPVATQVLTFTGPTAGRTITLPDANFTVARSDAAQSFTGTQTFLSNPVLDAGTANGVLYLDGSKVATSGSALTFDGANFTTTGTATGLRLVASSTDAGGSVLQVDTTATAFGRVGGSTTMGYVAGTQSLWTIGGSEQMRLTSTGLGIGTSSPTQKLTVSTSASDVTSFISSDTNCDVYFKASGTTLGNTRLRATGGDMVFITGLNDRMRLDSSGNLGLGVTPSAWRSTTKALQSTAGAIYDFSTTGKGITQNAYLKEAPDAWAYINNGPATQYDTGSGTHIWFTAPSGTAGNAISFTQSMTLDASGNLGIGTTSPASYGKLAVEASAYAVVARSGSSTFCEIKVQSGATDAIQGQFQAIEGGTDKVIIGARSAHPLSFNTGDTERARIPAAGGMVVGTAALATTATDGFMYVPTCAGTPTGTPTTQTGTAPIVVDTTNNKLYFYSGGQWRDAGP